MLTYLQKTAIWGAMFCGYAAFAAGTPPPVGQRTYIIDETKPGAPVDIEPSGTATPKTVLLKDPTMARKPSANPQVKRTTVAKHPKIVPAKMNFKTLAINGRMFNPRVEFERETLALPMVDEPVRQDFLQRVRDTVQSDLFEHGAP